MATKEAARVIISLPSTSTLKIASREAEAAKPNVQLLLLLLANKKYSTLATDSDFIEFVRDIHSCALPRIDCVRRFFKRYFKQRCGIDPVDSLVEVNSWKINSLEATSYGPTSSAFRPSLVGRIIDLAKSKSLYNSISNPVTLSAFQKVAENLQKLEELKRSREQQIEEEKRQTGLESLAEVRSRQQTNGTIPTPRQMFESRFLALSEETLVSIYCFLATKEEHISREDNLLVYGLCSKFMHPEITRAFPEKALKASGEAGLSPYSNWQTSAIKEIWGAEEKFEQGVRRWGMIQRIKWHTGKPRLKRLLRGE
jgi:hypothetical protein